jgi:hypothetical protein
VRGERLVVLPLLDRDEAERIRDLGVVAVVEATVVTAGGDLDLLEERDQILPPVGTGPEACDDDDHGDASIAVLNLSVWTGAAGQETDMATATELGQTGLQGWREKVADGISQPVANRAPLDEDQVRAVVGAAFFVLAVIYVVKTISAATRQARGG